MITNHRQPIRNKPAAAMVVGGGIGGMRAALDLADAGLRVYLIEHTPLTRAGDILEEVGLERERLGMFFMSGSQAQAFAAAAHTMTERIRQLGPNPLRRATHELAYHEQREMAEKDDSPFRGRRL